MLLEVGEMSKTAEVRIQISEFRDDVA